MNYKFRTRLTRYKNAVRPFAGGEGVERIFRVPRLSAYQPTATPAPTPTTTPLAEPIFVCVSGSGDSLANGTYQIFQSQFYRKNLGGTNGFYTCSYTASATKWRIRDNSNNFIYANDSTSFFVPVSGWYALPGYGSRNPAPTIVRQACPLPSATLTRTPTPTPTPSNTNVLTPTPTNTSPTATPSTTPSNTATVTPSNTNPTATPTRTSTPTPTPTRTPTPTATVVFNYTASFTGPGENEDLGLSIAEDTPGETDTVFVNGTPDLEPSWFLVSVYVNGDYRTTITYNSSRRNTLFGYKRSGTPGSTPEFIGTFPATPLNNLFFT